MWITWEVEAPAISSYIIKVKAVGQANGRMLDADKKVDDNFYSFWDNNVNDVCGGVVY